MRLYADGDRDFDKLPVAARMTCSVVLGRLSMPVDEALGLMTERRFRHLPVVEDGKLLGLVSIGDLVKVKLDEAAQETQALRAYIASQGLPLAPAAQQRKVKPEARAVEGGGVGIELRRVTLALLVEELLEPAALVAARLEVHDPALAGRVAEQAVDYVGAYALSRFADASGARCAPPDADRAASVLSRLQGEFFSASATRPATSFERER